MWHGISKFDYLTTIMDTVKLPFYARLAFILISFVLIILLLEQGSGIFIPLVFALLISILLYPLNRFLEQKLRMGRGLAAMLSLVLFITLLTAFIYFLTIQLASFADNFPVMKVRFQQMFNDLHHWLSYKMHINRATQNDYINKSAASLLENAASSVSNLFLFTSNILLLAVFVFMFTFFLLYHRRLLMNFTIKLFSHEHKEKVKEVIFETKTMINSYVAGLLLEMVIMSVANTALLLIMGVQYAVLLGVMAAVLNIIPYIGIYSATAFIALITFANSGLPLALQAGIGMLVLHIIDSNVLMPRIVGARVKMNPFVTVLAVIVGEYVWGIPGMFLFIPIIGMIKLICERVEGLEAWAILIGVDEGVKRVKKKVALPEPEHVSEAIENTNKDNGDNGSK